MQNKLSYINKLQASVWRTSVLITVIFAALGTLYIILSLKFPRTHTYHLAGSVATLSLIAVSFVPLVFNKLTTHIRHFLNTGEDVEKAYTETLRFAFRYSLSLAFAFITIVVLVMLYMKIATRITIWGLLDILLGGVIVVIPGSLLIYYSTQNQFLSLTKMIFNQSQLYTLTKDVRIISIQAKIVYTFLLLSIDIIVALGTFTVSSFINLEIPSSTYLDAVKEILVIAGIGIVIVLVCGIKIGQVLMSTLQSVSDSLQKISTTGGNLQQKTEVVTADEVGVIGGLFNTFQKSLQDIVTEIRQTSDNIANIAENLSAGSEEITASSEQINAVMDTISSGAQLQLDRVKMVVEFSENVLHEAESVLKATVTAEGIIEEVVKSAFSGQEKANRSVESIEKLVGETDRTVHNIKDLSSKVIQINSIAEAIRNISNQTNLLALNAAIESARAGEQGRGFGVIAQEIRKLNDDTNIAAQTITDMTGQIRISTETAINQIKNVATEVNSGKETIEQADFILRQIAFSISEAEQAVKMISHLAKSQQENIRSTVTLIEETAAVAHTNATSAQDVLEGSTQQVDSMGDMSRTAQELADAAIRLRNLLSQFHA